MTAKRTRPTKVTDLGQEIRRHLEAGKFRDTYHAKLRRGQRSVTRSELNYVLRNGRHVARKDEFKEEYGSWNYAVEGKTIDGKRLRIAIFFEDGLMGIATAIDLDLDE